MGMLDGFRKHYETRDNAVDNRLKTHYYKNNYNQVKQALVEAAKEIGFEMAHEDDTRQEHVLRNRNSEVIVTIVKITPIETTIDFTINTMGLLSFGKGRDISANLYKALDKRLIRK